MMNYLNKLSKKSSRDRLYDNVDYTQLTETDNGFIDSQLSPPSRIPWRSIILAALLFVGGIIFVTVGGLILDDRINFEHPILMWPVIIFGFLMFIAGTYHTRAAVRAYGKAPGYSFDDIPDLE